MTPCTPGACNTSHARQSPKKQTALGWGQPAPSILNQSLGFIVGYEHPFHPRPILAARGGHRLDPSLVLQSPPDNSAVKARLVPDAAGLQHHGEHTAQSGPSKGMLQASAGHSSNKGKCVGAASTIHSSARKGAVLWKPWVHAKPMGSSPGH